MSETMDLTQPAATARFCYFAGAMSRMANGSNAYGYSELPTILRASLICSVVNPGPEQIEFLKAWRPSNFDIFAFHMGESVGIPVGEDRVPDVRRKALSYGLSQVRADLRNSVENLKNACGHLIASEAATKGGVASLLATVKAACNRIEALANSVSETEQRVSSGLIEADGAAFDAVLVGLVECETKDGL